MLLTLPPEILFMILNFVRAKKAAHFLDATLPYCIQCSRKEVLKKSLLSLESLAVCSDPATVPIALSTYEKIGEYKRHFH